MISEASEEEDGSEAMVMEETEDSKEESEDSEEELSTTQRQDASHVWPAEQHTPISHCSPPSTVPLPHVSSTAPEEELTEESSEERTCPLNREGRGMSCAKTCCRVPA
jgi:hypothetical protein